VSRRDYSLIEKYSQFGDLGEEKRRRI